MTTKALVVDDSKTMRTIVGRILRELGYEVSEAGDGKEALQVLGAAKSTYGIVLTDWNMPGMNGLELLQELRKDRQFDAVKIIMITTETEIDHMTSALEAGANEYVMKPFTREILREKLGMIGILPVASGQP